MAKKNEIRVGNWVSKDGENYQSTTNTPEIIERGAELEPVVLSKEWLLKFGFTCQNSVSQHYKRYLNDVNSNCCYVELKQVGQPVWKVGFVDRWCVNPFMKDVEFVHQLQNLWFVYNDCELDAVS